MIIHWLIRRYPPMDIEGGSITLVTTLTKAPYPRQYARFFQRKATLYLSQGHFLKQQKAVLKKLSMMTSKTGKQVQSKRVMMINSKFMGVQQTISKIKDWMRQLIYTKMLYLCLLSSQGIVSGCCWVFQTITFIAFSVTSMLQKIRQLQVKMRERPVKIQPSITKPSQRTMIGRRVVIKPAWINERRRAFCKSMLSFRIRLVLRSVQKRTSVIHRGEIESINPIKNSPIAVQNLDINIIIILANYKQALVYENQGQIKMDLCLIGVFGEGLNLLRYQMMMSIVFFGCWLVNKIQCNQSLLVGMSSFAEDSFYNITETYHPRYRKGEFKHLLLNKNRSSPAQPLKQSNVELSDAILHNFNALGGYIKNLDELFKARMAVHEEEIIQIAHSEIKKIQLESQGIIQMYSDMIRTKNINSEILDLKYEVKYYQKRACQMFEQNKELKQKVKNLQAEIDMFKLEQQVNHIALRNVSKKYLKEKVIRRNMEMGSLKRRLVHEPSDSNIKISLLSRSAININPEKDGGYGNYPLSPTRQDSTKSKHKHGYSSSKKREEDNKSVQTAQIKMRVRTEPARDRLPHVVKFK